MIVRRGGRAVLASVGAIGIGLGTVIDFTAIDFTVAERSPGRTLKPFFTAQALKLGLLTPDKMLADAPQHAARYPVEQVPLLRPPPLRGPHHPCKKVSRRQ